MQLSIHQPLIWIVLAYSLGILVGKFIDLPLSYLVCLAFVMLLVSIFSFRREKISFIFLLFAFIFLGDIYTQSCQMLARNDVVRSARYYDNDLVVVKGMIASDIDQKSAFRGTKTTFYLKLYAIKNQDQWRPTSGTILVNIFRDVDLSYGDVVSLEGKLHRPFNFSSDKRFSYRDYLYNHGIQYILSVKKNAEVVVLEERKGNWLQMKSLQLRDYLSAILSKDLTPNEAAIMQALILGERSGIPRPMMDLFIQTGTVHILAISGMNIAMVAAIFLVLLKILPIGRKAQLVATIFLLIGYAFLTGLSPSVVRATIMSVVFLFGFLTEKEHDILNSLALSALIILLVSPLNLFDVGFQLSFICVLAIIFFYHRVKKLFGSRLENELDFEAERSIHGLIFSVKESLSLSLAVWIGVAGFIAYYFHIVTPVTILANLFVVPLTSVISVLGFGLLLSALTIPSLGHLFAVCIKVTLNILVGGIYLFAQIPYSYLYISDISLWIVGVYYFFILIAFFVPWENLRRWIAKKQFPA